jgi:hypothetical protein
MYCFCFDFVLSFFFWRNLVIRGIFLCYSSTSLKMKGLLKTILSTFIQLFRLTSYKIPAQLPNNLTVIEHRFSVCTYYSRFNEDHGWNLVFILKRFTFNTMKWIASSLTWRKFRRENIKSFVTDDLTILPVSITITSSVWTVLLSINFGVKVRNMSCCPTYAGKTSDTKEFRGNDDWK